MKKSILILLLVLLVFTTLLSGCDKNDEGALLATGAAQTVMVVNAQQTAMAGAILQITADAAAAPAAAAPAAPTLPPVFTPTLAGAAAAVAPAAATAAPAAASSGDMGQYVSDVIPDGTTYDPGTKFTQKWTLQNIGTSTWTADYAIVFVSGNQMGAPAKVNMPYSISPGMVVEIPVTFTAPTELGTYKSIWMLQNPNGTQFGLGSNNGSFWVQIIVSNLPTATNTPQATSTQDSGAIQGASASTINVTQKSCSHYIVEISGYIDTKDAVHVRYYWDLDYHGDGKADEDGVSDTFDDDSDGSSGFGVGPWGTSLYDVKDGDSIKACLIVEAPAKYSGGCTSIGIDCD